MEEKHNEKEDKEKTNQKIQEQLEIEKLKAECEDYKNTLKRLAAEFDNYKKRTLKDFEQGFELGKQEVLNNFLEIYDEVLIALQPANTSGDPEKIKEGFLLLQKKLSMLLGMYNLKEINCSGEPDPYLHEVILKVPGEPDGQIAQIIKKGYLINGKVLRPAKVSVYQKQEKQQKEKNEKEKN